MLQDEEFKNDDTVLGSDPFAWCDQHTLFNFDALMRLFGVIYTFEDQKEFGQEIHFLLNDDSKSGGLTP